MKRIWVRSGELHTEVAVQENGKLVEYYKGRRDQSQLAGNVYIGRVVRVLQGMQSAFVDIGLEKNAFLYIDDLLPAHLEKQPKEKPSIHELVKVGQRIMVQVVKEPVGSKGARITTHYSLPGRLGVYMPEADYIGVSRKIDGPDRDRLKRSAERQLQPGEGFIVRTAALGESEEAIGTDLEELRTRWRQLQRSADADGPVPRKIHSDLEMLPRLIRDLFHDDVESFVIDSDVVYREVQALVAPVSPSLAARVKLASSPAFWAEQAIDKQLELGLKRKIWLDNGSYLIVDRTEALTVFDVNTGKYTGSVDLERTVYDTNLEAAREIARLLRLRDIGGIIIVDFIDMETEASRQSILDELVRETRKDRTKTVVVGWTKLGLVELTRKKVRESKETTALEACPTCGGSGWVVSSGDE